MEHYQGLFAGDEAQYEKLREQYAIPNSPAGGLALMVFGSILPQGLMQTYTSFAEGYWHARNAEFMHQPWMERLVWLRVPGDIIFAAAAVLLLLFVLRLEWSRRRVLAAD